MRYPSSVSWSAQGPQTPRLSRRNEVLVRLVDDELGWAGRFQAAYRLLTDPSFRHEARTLRRLSARIAAMRSEDRRPDVARTESGRPGP